MKQFAVSAALLTALIALAGCPVPGTTPLNTAGSPDAGARRATAATVVTGRVLAPSNLIGQAGGNFISTNGGTVISTGGLNVIATGGGNFRTLQAGTTLISGAEVFLADAGGNPFPSLPTVKSNAEGVYTIPNVPADLTYMVVVRFKTTDGKTGRLQTLVRSTKLGATADVGAASTLVTAAVVARAQGGLGELDPAAFARAMAVLTPHLKTETLPDWTDRAQVVAAIEKLKAQVAELRAEIEGLQRAVEKLQASVEDVNARIDELQKSLPSASPSSASPPVAPTASPTPSPVVSASPSPAALKFELEAGYSDSDNPNGPWEFMWRNDGDWQKMRRGTNGENRESWIAENKDATISYGSSYIENVTASDGWLNVKPRDSAAAGFRWTAPQAGKVHLDVKLELEQAGGNGVKLQIFLDHGPDAGAKTTVREKALDPLEKLTLQVGETVTVKAGDRLYLAVSANEDGENDRLRMRASLSY